MKHLKIFSILFCCMAAMAFTSCLNDDNDKGLSQEQKHQAFLQMNGNYTTRAIYYSRLDGMTSVPGNKLDTLNAGMMLRNDSVIEFSMPTKALVSLMKDTLLARAIVAQMPQVNVRAYMGIYSVNPAAFYINPVPVECNSISYGGRTSNIRIIFANNFASSYGVYNADKRTLGVNLIVAGIYRDGQYDGSALVQAAPVLGLGKRN